MTLLSSFLLLLLNLTSASELPQEVEQFLESASSRQHINPQSLLSSHHYELHPESENAIIFIPGMGESALKYYDLYSSLNLSKPVAFYMWDHIGQGFSSHLIPDAVDKVHIETYDTYIQNLSLFLKKLRKKHKKVFLIAHSMGAHIALRISQNNPGLIDQMILSAPMIDIRQTGVPLYLINWTFKYFPKKMYPPFYFLFQLKSKDGSYISNSKERIDTYKKITDHFPQILRQGVTVGWITATQESIKTLSQLDFANYKTPILILQAQQEYLVSNEAQDGLCQKIKTCRIEVMENSKHEVLFETDPVRNKALDLIKKEFHLKDSKVPLKKNSQNRLNQPSAPSA